MFNNKTQKKIENKTRSFLKCLRFYSFFTSKGFFEFRRNFIYLQITPVYSELYNSHWYVKGCVTSKTNYCDLKSGENRSITILF